MKKNLLTILLLVLATPIFAWNAKGHMTVAAIAYNQLDSIQKIQVTELLKSHPDYKDQWAVEYKNIKNDLELGQYLMMRASVWPDEIKNRNNPNKKYSRPEWHYITYKIKFETHHDTTQVDGNVEPNVVWAIDHSTEMIKDNTQDQATRAMYMAWLIHLIGDVHQPLHCGSIFDASYPKGDKGGNGFYVKPSSSSVNLHALWDGALGRGKTKDAVKIKNQSALITQNQSQAISGFSLEYNPRKWSIESFDHAVAEVHLNGDLKGSTDKTEAPSLPDQYTKDMQTLSEKRCLLAGKRLGTTINNFISYL
ncbi:S1/P1 nuclease [Limibacter armeniacum]|uniref:S1/P1 nuclease n=1 Tax=Limibacter armeniacum TaxID=466084 RepID=UPI002FE65C33